MRMKAAVCGATGFIGSHVAEQLSLAGHEVTAILRPSSDATHLPALAALNVKRAVLEDLKSAREALKGADVVYNCTARPHPNLPLEEHRKVEVHLARKLAMAAAEAGVRRFVQLSTIQVHGSRTPATLIHEETPLRADTAFQQAYIEREQVVFEVAALRGLEVVVYRPASTIGARDTASFFSRLVSAYRNGRFPLARHNRGATRVSLIDARDVGRSMEWLGRYPPAAGEVYLGKGFDVCWRQLKEKLDTALGVVPQKRLPPAWLLYAAATISEWRAPPPKIPALSRFVVLALTHDVVIDDRKLRSTGFTPKYGFDQSVAAALEDIADVRGGK